MVKLCYIATTHTLPRPLAIETHWTGKVVFVVDVFNDHVIILITDFSQAMHHLLHGVHRHTVLTCTIKPLCLADTVRMYTVHCTTQLAVVHGSKTHLCEPQLLMTSHSALNNKVHIKSPSVP